MQVNLRRFIKPFTSRTRFGFSSQVVLPNKIGVLGYGSIARAFVEMLLQNNPKANVVVVDLFDMHDPENRFKFMKRQIDRTNIADTFNFMGLKKGDFLVDLSTNIEFLEMWPLTVKQGICYINTSLELWEDNKNAVSYPKNLEEMYKTSIGYLKDQAENSSIWDPKKGTTSILEMGMNPGLVSTFVKKGLEDAAKHFLKDENVTDIDKKDLEKRLAERNHSKIAQLLGVQTIHCSEQDNQTFPQKPKDVRTKLYNTWSCRGLLTEGLLPIQVGKGSHEDKKFKDFEIIHDGKIIMSWKPCVDYWAKSWIPNQDIIGCMIPHGEAYTITDYLHDPETGYSPSQYFVYDYNPYAKEFVQHLPKDATIENTNPPCEVIHPMFHPTLRGNDKVGALLVMKNNRGWWTGSIMDDVDASALFNHKFGPTVLQVAAGLYSGFLWACKNPQAGSKFPDNLDTDFVIETARPYLGRLVSTYVDLTTTHLKDCSKLQSYMVDRPKA